MDLKQIVVESALELGFQRTVIAGLTPLEPERQRYEDWLAKDYAGSMDYLKRNPQFRTTPRLLFPQSLSAIVVTASYYSHRPESPGPGWGAVANYAVGLDYHVVLKAKLRNLKALIEKRIGRTLIGKAFTDDVALYEQGLAARYGLGFAGKNTLIIGPKLMGSFNFIAELMTDLPLEPDESYKGTCGACFRCGDACPTGAIVEAGTVDARRCISYLTIENKEGIPLELRPQLGSWLFGCDICQVVCPYNQRPPETQWQEFLPQSGVGHFMDLIDLLKIKSQEEFHARFVTSAVRRPKRRGMIRNALVVLGNQRAEHALPHLINFAKEEPDAMLREHAEWAIAQYKN